ncbi:MAG: DUF839 domain-containing protein [Arenicellales bacterium]|jgi:hypothetical protein|nr:DUF839 domain-containing protein [Arenicellales bacterium]
MALSRRQLLAFGTAGIGALIGVSWVLRSQFNRNPDVVLVTDPAGIIDLPKGFSYHILERSGDPMSDGFPAPGLPDGMACFSMPNNQLVLVINAHLLDTSFSC